jgi:twitching motility protein PilT
LKTPSSLRTNTKSPSFISASCTPTARDLTPRCIAPVPDVILVGEMRDKETIEIVLEAAETGHLVFSTMHTVDASATMERRVGVF